MESKSKEIKCQNCSYNMVEPFKPQCPKCGHDLSELIKEAKFLKRQSKKVKPILEKVKSNISKAKGNVSKYVSEKLQKKKELES